MFLVVGASARALMESVVESGYQATAVDFFGDQDCRWCGEAYSLAELGLRPSAKHLLQAAVRVAPPQGAGDGRQDHSGLVYAAGPENDLQGLEVWERRGLLLGNGTLTLRQVRNPWVLQESLAAIGCLMPPFYTLEEWRAVAAGGEAGWIVKPVNGGGGRGIVRLATEKTAAFTQLAAVNDKSRYIVQRFIPGVAASVTFIADGHRAVVVGTSRQLTAGRGLGGGPFRYAGSMVPLVLGLEHRLPDPGTELERIVGHLTAVFGLRGINTLDFIINRQGIWVLEVNPRWSASVELIERWRGERLFSCHLAACGADGIQAGGRPVKKDRIGGFWGKAVVYAENSFTVTTAGQEIADFYQLGLRDIPVCGAFITTGQPLCSVLAWGATDASCWRSLTVKAAWARQILGDVPVADRATRLYAGAGQATQPKQEVRTC
ncbi:MAG: ATP-grasp domain-containing protein [Negativicutes bacterium]|nr:ATP-grasp domain-containing protein [Negativicutes bacterium]